MNPSPILLAAVIAGSLIGAVNASAAGANSSEAVLITQLNKAETAFWSEFDRVNTNPAYETHCEVRTRYESHLQSQVCLPKFFTSATEAEGQWDLGSLSGFLGAYHPPFAPPADEIIRAKMKAYRDRVHDLAGRDAKLAQLARDYLTLRKQFETAHGAL